MFKLIKFIYLYINFIDELSYKTVFYTIG